MIDLPVTPPKRRRSRRTLVIIFLIILSLCCCCGAVYLILPDMIGDTGSNADPFAEQNFTLPTVPPLPTIAPMHNGVIYDNVQYLPLVFQSNPVDLNASPTPTPFITIQPPATMQPPAGLQP